jgi:hypothetical protein
MLFEPYTFPGNQTLTLLRSYMGAAAWNRAEAAAGKAEPLREVTGNPVDSWLPVSAEWQVAVA